MGAALVVDADEQDLGHGFIGGLLGSVRSGWDGEEAAGPEAGRRRVRRARHLDERADDSGERLARGHAEVTPIADRDGELEVVARRGEGQGRAALVGHAEALAEHERPAQISEK